MALRMYIVTILVVIAGYFGYVSPAFALTVSPARIELTGEPGTTIGGEINLFNEQDEQKTFYVSSENFEAQGESGAPNFVPGTEGLATWIDATQNITLPAGATETVPFSITIPSDARPGGHFAAIFWGTNPPSSGNGQVSVGARVGVLVLLRVAGDISEQGGITEFSTDLKKHFYTKKELGLMYRFQNAGDDRLLPEGTIVIKNFGIKVAELNANQSLGNVLPGSVRKFTTNWNGGNPDHKLSFAEELKHQFKHFGFGWYKATVSLSYGSEGTTESKSVRFWVISWQIVIIILAAIALLFFGGRFILRRYNHWIIAKAQKYLALQQQHDEEKSIPKPRRHS